MMKISFSKSTLFLMILFVFQTTTHLSAQTLSSEEIAKRIAEKAKKVAEMKANVAQSANKTALTSPEQDCPDAIPIVQNIFYQPNSYVGEGAILNEINPAASCLGTGENNDVWYTFISGADSSMGFSIIPNSATDDYDWAVYDITGTTCAAIYNNPLLEISCNFSANVGCGGVTGPNGQTSGSCAGQNDPYFLTTQGHKYMINVSNFSSTQSGYTLEIYGSLLDNYSVVNGSVYIDANNNCVQDLGETPMSNTVVPIQNLAYPYVNYMLTNSTGNFNILADTGVYQISAPTYLLYYTSCVGASIIDTLHSVDTITANFGMTPIANMNDLTVDLVSSAIPVPNATRTYTLSYHNVGTTTQTPVLKFTYPSALSTVQFVSATGNFTINGDTITWDSLPPLAPFGSGMETVTLHYDSTLTLGVSFLMTAAIMPIQNDQTPVDNQDYIIDISAASYDPNDKSVNLLEVVDNQANETWLEYVIRFQNTGTAPAQKVVIKDEMSQYLDLASLQILGNSHPVTVSFTGTNPQTANFTFNNINLADSFSNEPASHGFVKYRMRMRPNLAVGTQINNSANIYFDFNTPVLTNTVTTTIRAEGTLSNEFSQTENLKVYPNPAKDKLHIWWNVNQNEVVTLKLMNLNGQIVYEKQINLHNGDNQHEIEVNRLPKGMYLLQNISDKGISLHKIWVQ